MLGILASEYPFSEDKMVVNVAGFGIRDKGLHGQIVESVVLLAIVCQFLCIVMGRMFVTVCGDR